MLSRRLTKRCIRSAAPARAWDSRSCRTAYDLTPRLRQKRRIAKLYESQMSHVALTGAAGFLGQAIAIRLSASGRLVRALTRNGKSVPSAYENVASGDLCDADLEALVARCDVLVNCAARVHVLRQEDPATAQSAYCRINKDFPIRLARVAKAAGVRHFVQISSAAAIASVGAPGETISDQTSPRPAGAYGRTKLEADRALLTLSDESFAVSCLRPPAIYGPGVQGWFGLLNRAARLGLPLPLAGTRNQRSFAFSGNIADAVKAVLDQPMSGAWLVTDSEPLSTSELYAMLLALHGHANRLFSIPNPLLNLATKLVLRGRASSLLGDAAFDGSRFADTFRWKPPTSLDNALALTVSARS